jgi:carboxymethylenebutenolidase
MRTTLLSLVALFLSASFLRAGAPSADTAEKALSSSPRHGEWVDIDLPAGGKLHTWIVYPERKDKAPVVLVIHEIFGMSDWVRAMADDLAAQGFIAVAPDLLSGKGPNGGNTDSMKGNQVGEAIRKLTPDEIATRLDAARDYAIKLPSATDKTATIGFCWGGGVSFAYAAHDPRLSAAVVFYGTPPKKDAMEQITAPVAGFYGGDDARITATVEPTKQLMSDLKKSYAPYVFDGAGHGFMRQQSGRNGANQKAADQAWPEAISFLKKNLE